MIYNYKNINNYIKEERFEELIRISEEKIRLQFETLLKLIRVKDEPSQDALTDLLMVTDRRHLERRRLPIFWQNIFRKMVIIVL